MRVRLLLFLATIALGVSAITTTGNAQDRPAVFTAAQAEAGRRDFQQNGFGVCGDCHLPDLRGRNGEPGELPLISSLPENYQKLVNGINGKVPDLVGAPFRSRWVARSTRDLTREFRERFSPPSGPLTEQTRLNMVAFILQANGAPAGAQPLTMDTDVSLREILPLGAAVRAAR